MLCPSCQAPNETDAGTCISCGESLAGLAPGHVVASRYEILGTLGKGGMGMVFKARDRVLEETVALKILRTDVAATPELARRFRQEIKLARRVRHKNVCGIHEYGEDGALRFIAMDLVDGVDLRHVLRERGPLPAPEAVDVALRVAEGLAAIHDEGIVHRDLKTANIMIDGHGSVRLMDFGIAKATEEGTSGVTATGVIVGTPEYMSPEQARGARVDLRSDIYALGIILYELLTGDVPFRGDTPITTILKQIQEAPALQGPDARRIPAGLRPVLARALAKDPVARYSTAREMIAALRQAANGASPESLPAATVAEPAAAAVPAAGEEARRALPRRARASPLVGLAIGAAIVLTAAAAVASYALFRIQRPAPAAVPSPAPASPAAPTAQEAASAAPGRPAETRATSSPARASAPPEPASCAS